MNLVTKLAIMPSAIQSSVSDQFILSGKKNVPHHDATPNHKKYLDEVKEEARRKRNRKALAKAFNQLQTIKGLVVFKGREIVNKDVVEKHLTFQNSSQHQLS